MSKSAARAGRPKPQDAPRAPARCPPPEANGTAYLKIPFDRI